MPETSWAHASSPTRLAPLALAFSSLACADFTTDDATYSARLISGAIEVMRIDEKNDTCVHLVINTIGDPATPTTPPTGP